MIPSMPYHNVSLFLFTLPRNISLYQVEDKGITMKFIQNEDLREWVKENLKKAIFQKVKFIGHIC